MIETLDRMGIRPQERRSVILLLLAFPYHWQYRLADDEAGIAATANFARPVPRGK